MIDTTKLRELADSAGFPADVTAPSIKRFADSLFICEKDDLMNVVSEEIRRLQDIEAAARNLAKVKGRHHSEQAMNQLLEALK